jgi:hypothetical protein
MQVGVRLRAPSTVGERSSVCARAARRGRDTLYGPGLVDQALDTSALLYKPGMYEMAYISMSRLIAPVHIDTIALHGGP